MSRLLDLAKKASAVIAISDQVNIYELVGDLTQEPEAKTLEECLQEAGGFPFVARVIEPGSGLGGGAWSIGAEVRFTKDLGLGSIGRPIFAPAPTLRADGTVADYPRWFLVGHRT
jgi:hypothetical protein